MRLLMELQELNRKHEMFLNQTSAKDGYYTRNLTVNMKCF